MQVCPQCQSDRLVNNGSAGSEPLLRSTTRSRSLPAERSSWSWMRCGTISSKNGANSGSERPWIVTPGSYWTGSVVDVTKPP
jgi:hypothetical protein